MSKKLCVDCKHVEMARGLPKCMRPSRDSSLVTGQRLLGAPFTYCSIEREDGWLFARALGTCGVGARFFEYRDSPEGVKNVTPVRPALKLVRP